jgi:hypothetical protein
LNSAAWRSRPLKVAFGRSCVFRPLAVAALDRAGVDWDMVLDTDSDRSIEATVSADLAVNVMIEGTEPPHLEPIQHGGTLPDLPAQRINLYCGSAGGEPLEQLAGLVRDAFRRVAVPLPSAQWTAA